MCRAVQAQEEVDRVLGDRDQPTVADYGQLKYVMRCVNESMRLYPHPPVLLRRAMIADELPGGPCCCPNEHDCVPMHWRRAGRLGPPWQADCLTACRLGFCSSLGRAVAIAACTGQSGGVKSNSIPCLQECPDGGLGFVRGRPVSSTACCHFVSRWHAHWRIPQHSPSCFSSDHQKQVLPVA